MEFAILPPPLLAITGKKFRSDFRFTQARTNSGPWLLLRIDGGGKALPLAKLRRGGGPWWLSPLSAFARRWTGLKGPVETFASRSSARPPSALHGFPALARPLRLESGRKFSNVATTLATPKQSAATP